MTKRNMLEDHHPELDFLGMHQNMLECQVTQNKGAEPPIIKRKMRSTPQKNYRLPTQTRQGLVAELQSRRKTGALSWCGHSWQVQTFDDSKTLII
ncbi:uncharacterized protein PADG_11094 [Paracoccidioides brasiliensis Pb18]|uniref:Uncharacterized protein n=1 Tax=Paracoccidioides brasiliensis (strain Pb18) TaxID=502780 RepID=A0A0A0HVP6_PARBD|nr:uncharacterized protein PADG_11094 [Paracoccidioides brasiliensis Pb18]KGM92642.1 hypothetical protein PADG_11094 [Paracoccidioides brasiliensis Pb18]